MMGSIGFTVGFVAYLLAVVRGRAGGGVPVPA